MSRKISFLVMFQLKVAVLRTEPNYLPLTFAFLYPDWAIIMARSTGPARGTPDSSCWFGRQIKIVIAN
ncbi:MAG: hypothetical protein ACPL5I_16575 [Thermodesulfobacteriota bacterium]